MPTYKNQKVKTIHQMFEEQVLRTPDHIAIVYEDKQLSYRELNTKANQLAHYLLTQYQIKGEDLIALHLDRSEQMLVTLLAVLKAGAAYVPMDPGYPDERIAYILNDTRAKLVISNESHQSRLVTMISDHSLQTCVELIDNQDFPNQLEAYAKTNPSQLITSNHLAYVIYTSGTTGNPKGVMIEHHSVMKLCEAFIKIHQLKENQTAAVYSNYVFDAFVYETLPPLLNGNQLYLLSNEIRLSIDNLAEFINSNRIQIMFIPPVLINELLQRLNQLDHRLRILFTGGDQLPPLDFAQLGDIKLFNEYGPSETTVCATYHHYQANDLYTNIGKPIDNVTISIIGDEIVIGGAGVARGYLNRPDETAQRFISDPHSKGRLYKTGDLARYLPNGDIEFRGRNDFQVKIRGFRIELGEIESKLLRYPQIKQAVVLARENKNRDKYLAGYYVADFPLVEKAILDYLRNQLPDYMIPPALVWLNKLPLTVNGKLDRKALPEPQLTAAVPEIMPLNELESKLCEIYADSLGLPLKNISIHDDFFMMGGNSLLAIRLVSRLNREIFNNPSFNLNKMIHVSEIFKYKTIHHLLDNVLSEDEREVILIPKSSGSTAPLSFAQERLWFIENYESGSNAYHIPFVWKLSVDINLKLLESALQAVVSRHAVLHSLIKTNIDGQGFQEITDLKNIPLTIHSHIFANHQEIENFINIEINQIFILDLTYPIRIYILEQQDNTEKFLFVVVHHIAFDGWSMDVFRRDLQTYYDGKSLPELSIQYKDFAVWQREYLSGDRLEHSLNYWKNKLSDYEGLNLPTDKPRPSDINYEGDDVHFIIDQDLSNQLRAVARQLSVSLYSLLLSGFNLLLSSYSNQKEIVVGIPIANRHHPQLEDLIGFFVNSLALRSQINEQQTLGDYISSVGHDVIEAQLHQDLPFEKLVEELDIPKDPSRHPVFQVMFSVQSFGNYAEIKKIKNPVARFDLSVFIDDSQSELHGTFNYAKSLYEKKTMEIWISTYRHILKQLASDLSLRINSLSYLDTTSYRQIIYQWNQTDCPYSTDKTIHQLFEEQVNRTPENIAVVYEDKQLTYGELNAQANQLAHYTRSVLNFGV